MKKILYTLIIFVTFISWGAAQTFELSLPEGTSKKVTLDPEDVFYNYKFKGTVKNLTNNEINMIWEITPIIHDEKWYYTLCDPGGCLQDTRNSSFKLSPKGDGIFEVGVIASGIAGKGKYSVKLYDEKNKAAAITKEFNFDFQTPVGNDDAFMKSNLAIGPNPFSDNVNISNLGKVGIEKIQIMNMLGYEVMNQTYVHHTNDINISLSNLDKGLYMTVLHSKNGKLSKMIVKE